VDDSLTLKVRTDVLPIVERYQVQLVLTGHEHSYQRSKPLRAGQVVKSGPGTVYITTGGGGGVPHPTVYLCYSPVYQVSVAACSD
jgi:hypothetical protein